MLVWLEKGLLEGDGVFILLGYLFFLFNVVFFTLLPVVGYEALLRLIGIL